MKETNATEIEAFFGLCYIIGLLKLTFYNVQHSVSRLYGNAAFSATMSLNRFKFLLAHLRFDDKATRKEHWNKTALLLCETFF